MSPLKQSTNHRQRRPLPSIPTTSEVKPISNQKRRSRGQLGKPPIPQPRKTIKQQSREPSKPSHPRNYSHQQVQLANETATSESENLSDHIAVSGASETSTTLSKKCIDFVVDFLTIMSSDLKSRQLKLSDGNSQPENSPVLQNASSDQLKNSKSGSNMPDNFDNDYSERNDDVMNFQNQSRKGRLCPGESRIKEKDWDANQEKTLHTNVYTHPQNWSERRDQMEQEKLESAYLEKLEQLERDKLENERKDKKRLGQLRLESKQSRLPVKRPYDSREGKEEFWMKSKRPVVTKTRFASNSTSSSDRLFGGSRGRNKTLDSREIEGTTDDRRDMDNFSRDNRPKRRPTIRFERENDRSGTWYDWKDSFHHVQSDRRKKRYRDRCKTRTLPMDNGHEWKSKRENAVMETSFSRDNWQGGGNSPNEENVSLMEITYNPGQGPLGGPPDSQRNWDSIAERRKKDSSWSASKHKENRILGFEPQDRLTWNNLALQPNTWQQGFGTQMTSGHLETRVPVMFLAPQHAGMVLTNNSLTGGLGQTEPRFDAYKSMQTQFRRY